MVPTGSCAPCSDSVTGSTSDSVTGLTSDSVTGLTSGFVTVSASDLGLTPVLPSSSVVGVIVSGTIGALSGVLSTVIGMYLRLPFLSAGPTIGFVSAARRLINFAARAPEIFKSRCKKPCIEEGINIRYRTFP